MIVHGYVFYLFAEENDSYTEGMHGYAVATWRALRDCQRRNLASTASIRRWAGTPT